MRRRTILAASLALGGVTAASADDLRTGLFRGQPVTYKMVHGRAVFQGDMLLDHVTRLPRVGDRSAPPPPSVGVAYGQYLWPKNAQGVAQIPYIITTPADNLSAALTAFNNTFPNVIQFVPLGSQTDYVNFDFESGNTSGECESYVGRTGGEQVVTGSVSCSLGTLLHEMGHVLGLYHEMTRPDYSTYITINYNNVIKGSEDNFTPLTDNFQDLTLFDYASVMMYIPFAFTRNGGPVLDTLPPGMQLSSLNGYSAGDIDGIERLYGAIPTKVTVTSNPPGLSVVVDGSTVTTPQTYSWRLKSTHTLEVPMGAQTLSGGGTYTYGRWNDSTEASHSIKLLPGNNTVTQPATSPAVTVYTANFVQLSAYTANVVPSGSGSVAVNPPAQTYQGASGQFLVARQPVTVTPTPTGSYKFVTFGGTSAPYSANPKPDYVPDGTTPYALTGYFSTEPITTVTTTPGGFWFTVDGDYYKAPQNFTEDVFGSGWAPGTSHTVTGFSPNEPYSVNTRYLFDSWSDGGALSHMFTVPTGASTLTGTFTAQYVPGIYTAPSCAATLTVRPNSSTGFYNAGTVLTAKLTNPATGLFLTGWTGDITGKKTNEKLTVNDEELAVANYNVTTQPFAVTSLSPDIFVSGSAGGTVKIKGTGFGPNEAIFVNNVYRGSTYVNSKEIEVVLTASDLTTPGAFPIGVSNYPAGGSCGNYAELGFFVALP
jgi:Astacin (Peptidase family M12A)